MPFRPFLVMGVDYCGPLFVKMGTRRNAKIIKAYVAVFVCFCTKAVHLEVVQDLTSEAFIVALRRFISRRGKCRRLCSDNATNFVGANRELQELHELFNSENFQSKIQRVASEENLEWKWIPPRTPHAGGLWEAAVNK